MTTAEDYFSFTVKVDFQESHHRFDQAGIVLYLDSENWLKAGKTYESINVEKEKSGKIFSFYQDLIKLRKTLPIIAEGDYKAAYKDSDKVYAFERQLGSQELLVLNNFFPETLRLNLSADYQAGQVLISNYDEVELAEKIILKPYQPLTILVD